MELERHEARMIDHIMIDLETLGNGPDGAIASVGAVAFDPLREMVCGMTARQALSSTPEQLGATGLSFYVRVDLARSASPGVIDASTVEWWLGKDKAAQQELVGQGRMPLEQVLTVFHAWVQQVAHPAARVWAKPPNFDVRLMEAAYRRCFKPSDTPRWPFLFWNERCARTIMAISPASKIANPAAHNALSDAVVQACEVSRALVALKVSRV